MASTENTDVVADQEATTSEPRGEWLEYEGEEPHGTAFLQSHTIPKGDAIWKRLGVKPTKDLVWERDPLGPAVGQKGNRMLLSTEGLDPELVAVIDDHFPNIKRVNE